MTLDEKTCELHRQVLCVRLDNADFKTQNLQSGIDEIRDLYKTLLYALIFIGFATTFTLLGVLLGCGVDVGWLVI